MEEKKVEFTIPSIYIGQTQDLQKPKVVVEIDGKQYVTLRDYTFVVGKDKPEINLEVKK